MTRMNHTSQITFSSSQYASLKDEKNADVDKRIVRDVEWCRNHLCHLSSNSELYEFNDMKKVFVKPHFEIDYPWEEIDLVKRDELIMNASIFIVNNFNCDFTDICVLFDAKKSKCSLHFNIANCFTTMEQLIHLKRAKRDEMENHHFDLAVYRMGANKWRTVFANKIKNGVAIGSGLQKCEFDDLGINAHEDIDYLITYTHELMEEWDFIKSEKHTAPAEIEEMDGPDPTGVITPLLKHHPCGVKLKSQKCDIKEMNSNLQGKNKLINELVQLIIDTKQVKIHTHQNITTTAKGLVNDGFIEEGKYLVLNSMNTNHKNLNIVWNDCFHKSRNTKRTAFSVFHLAKQCDLKKYNYICAKHGETNLPPQLYTDLFKLKNGITELINERYLPASLIDTIQDNQTTFIKSHLGTGKTTIMKQLIKLHPNKNIIYFAPRIAFAKQVCSELNGFTFYGDLKETSEENLKNKIVIQMESLWKVANTKYDIVIFDEPESGLKQLSSVDTMGNKILENHKVFEKIIRNAEKVICCDAFLSNKTVEVMNMISSMTGLCPKKTATVVNEYNPYSRKSIEMKTDEELKKQLFNDLKDNKKCVFVCGSKSKAETIFNEFKKAYPDKNGKFYYGNMNENEKQFGNIDSEWSTLDLLIYTPVITCGVNYDPELPTFDRLYIYGTPHSACVRDVFQASLRVRKLKDNLMFYVISNKPNNKETCPVGFLENYELIQKNKQFVNDKSLFVFEKVNEWVMWNYAYNKNEEGIKNHYYRQAFYDYLKVCGYDNTKVEPKFSKSSIDASFTPFDKVKEVEPEEYKKLQGKYYELTEEEKDSMRLFEYSELFEVNDTVWDILEMNKNIIKNIPCEFTSIQNLIDNEEQTSTQIIDIYADSRLLKLEALKSLNKILGVENTLNVKYSSLDVVEKQPEIEKFIEEYRGLFTIRKHRGKGMNTKYVNSVVQSIYEEWNGCKFIGKSHQLPKDENGKRKKFYTYDNQGAELIQFIRKHKK